MRERLGGRFHPVACDLRNESDILRMFAEIETLWGGVDILVNNAGLGHKAPLLSGSTEHWREMLDVNILALCVCTREATRQMHARGQGHVIHISSMSAHRVPPNSGVYSATKFAVRSLTEGLRQELREQMRAAMDSLGERHREILVLREVEGLSYEELSDILEVPKGTIMSRLFHARKNFQQALARYLNT